MEGFRVNVLLSGPPRPFGGDLNNMLPVTRLVGLTNLGFRWVRGVCGWLWGLQCSADARVEGGGCRGRLDIALYKDVQLVGSSTIVWSPVGAGLEMIIFHPQQGLITTRM